MLCGEISSLNNYTFFCQNIIQLVHLFVVVAAKAGGPPGKAISHCRRTDRKQVPGAASHTSVHAGGNNESLMHAVDSYNLSMQYAMLNLHHKIL